MQLTTLKTRSPAISEKAARTALSPIAVQHAEDGYSRRGDFGDSLVHNVLMYTPDSTKVCGTRGGQLEGVHSA